MIKVNNLLKVFNNKKRNEVRAINDVTLEFPEKGLVAIYGASGSGKTTLMNTLGGLDTFDGGEIIMDGNVYKKSVDDKYRIENIGYVFQNYLLDEHLDVYQNVAQGLRTEGVKDEEVIFKRVMVALDNVGMRAYFKRNVTTLSGGQQQRVAIARAMVKGAKIILADEPTGNLDENNTRTVMELLKAMSNDCLVIVVTHEGDLIDKYADSVIEIRDGRVNTLAEGSGAYRESFDKTKIFLLDKPKKEYEAGGLCVEYYGEEQPLRLTVVSEGGKFYLACENGDIKFVDKDSEIKLIKKTKADYLNEERNLRNVSMSYLGSAPKGKAGAVFGFKDSLIAGFNNAFGKNKKRLTIFTVAVMIFMIAIIFIWAGFGASYYSYTNVGSDYNPYLVSMLASSEQRDKIIEMAEEKGYDIDYMYLNNYGGSLNFYMNGFESFENVQIYYDNLTLNSYEKAKQSRFLAGSADNLDGYYNIAVSKSLADKIVRQIEQETGAKNVEYEFIFNCKSLMYSHNSYALKIVAVVDDEYDYLYLHPVLMNMMEFNTGLDSQYGKSIADNEILLPMSYASSVFDGYYSLNGKLYKAILDDSIDEKCLNINSLTALNESYVSSRELCILSKDADELTDAIVSNNLADFVRSKSTQTYSQKLYAMQSMVRTGIVLAAFLLILCVAVSLMFYATLSLRAKEIGLYRAIGVSSQNVLYKFFVESLALVIVSVVAVYVLIGLPILIFSSGSGLYLPLWLYLSSFVLMSGIVIFFAVLPVMIFVKKSPIRILAKYDV